VHAPTVTQPAIALTARHVPFDEIARADWDRLFAATPAATPFSRWTFHRAWWDAYGTTAHDRYLVVTTLGANEVRGIVPLMFRHEVEAEDAPTHTVVREHSPTCETVPGEAAAIMFGASYHADYATILAAPEDIAAVSAAAADSFCDEHRDGAQPWDVVDLRRLREVDPVLLVLESVLNSVGAGEAWHVTREKEDVCPVVTVSGDTWDEYLATLDKTARHEIRRKMRRAAAIGELSIEIAPPTPAAIADFIRLHDLRFGESGLFPHNEGGARSRRFVERLAELELAEGDRGILHVARVWCGKHLVFVMVAFDDGETCYLYNAGLDPEAKNTSPGVTGAGLYIKDRIEAGRRRFDYLRGEERYKYEWGAVDEPIYRLLVTRGAGSAR
jgi:CelD/BcsL family acetyltransferase involved in cellulose biosynthesis